MPTVIQVIRPADLGAEFAIVANKVRAGAATQAAAGVVRQATNAEVSSGTVVVAFTTPDQVASAIAGATPVAATTAVAGVSRLATNAEALAGTSNTITVTPATATDCAASRSQRRVRGNGQRVCRAQPSVAPARRKQSLREHLDCGDERDLE